MKKTTEEKTTSNRLLDGENVIKAATKVSEAHLNFLKACNEFADVIHHPRNHVLIRLMDQQYYERDDPKRVFKWLRDYSKDIELHMESVIRSNKEASERAALLEQLQLTAEQIALLGIKAKATKNAPPS